MIKSIKRSKKKVKKLSRRFLEKTSLKVLSLAISLSFFMTVIIPTSAKAEGKGTSTDFETGRSIRSIVTDIGNRFLDLPAELGYVQEMRAGGDNTIIFIQDAHCNYSAQKAIAGIIGHLNKVYGVGLICLEGGSGEYDLSSFTRIREKDVRDKVAQLFMEQGILNGGEYAAALRPGVFSVWGIENPELYMLNLQVYRESLGYRERISGYLKALSETTEDLKKSIYSPELSSFDKKYSEYKNKTLTLKEYLQELMDRSRANLLPIKRMGNVFLLKQVMEEEDRIDFRKADRERAAFLEDLKNKLSRNEYSEMLKASRRLAEGRLGQKEYYNLIIEMGKRVGQEISSYPDFRAYIVYISLYTSIDRSRMMKEIGELEDSLRAALCRDGKQKELLEISKKIGVSGRAFGVQMTKSDFDYYASHVQDFKVEEVLSFIRREAPSCDLKPALPQGIEEIDIRLKEMEKFYLLSFQRDETFLENIQKKMTSTGYRSAMLLAGGFHSENLSELMSNKGFSYVTILPRFRTEETDVNPYFDLLAGKETGMIAQISIAINSSMLQVASLWNRLGVEAFGEREKNGARIAVAIARKLVEGEKAVVALRGTDKALVFSMDRTGKLSFSFDKMSGRDAIADINITGLEDLTYEEHEELIDKQLAEAYADRSRRVSSLDDKDIRRSVELFFVEIGKKEIAQAVHEAAIEINLVEGVSFFKGHAGAKGINMNSDLLRDPLDLAATLVHEIGAYCGQAPSRNNDLERLYRMFAKNGIGKENPAAIEVAKEKVDLSGLSIGNKIRSETELNEFVEQLAIEAIKEAAERESSPEAVRERERASGTIQMTEKIIKENIMEIDPVEKGLLFRGLMRAAESMNSFYVDPRVTMEEILGFIVRNAIRRKELIVREKVITLILDHPEIFEKTINDGENEFLARGTALTEPERRMFFEMCRDIRERLLEATGQQQGFERKDIESITAAVVRENTKRGCIGVIDVIQRESSSPDETERIPEVGDILLVEEGRGVQRDFGKASEVSVAEKELTLRRGTFDGRTITRECRIVSKGGRISQELIESMRDRAEDIVPGYLDAGKLSLFLASWEIITIEDNDLMPAFVDAADRKLYLSHTLSLAAGVSPQIVPIIILSEVASPGREMKDLAKEVGIKDPNDSVAGVFIRGVDPEVERAIIKACGEISAEENPINLETIMRAVAKESTEEFSTKNLSLLRWNLDRPMSNGEKLSEGLLDRLFGEGQRVNVSMTVLRDSGADAYAREKLAETILALSPGAWVAFADGMAGKAREKYVGSPIMDTLSPEATKTFLAFAEERGVFCYNFGKDEHAFVFPENKSEEDVEAFFLDAMEELAKGSNYTVYRGEWEELPARVGEMIEKLTNEGVNVAVEDLGGGYHVMFPRTDDPKIVSLRTVLTEERAEELSLPPFLMPAGAVKLDLSKEADIPGAMRGAKAFAALFRQAEKQTGEKWTGNELSGMKHAQKEKLWAGMNDKQKEAIRENAWRMATAERKTELKDVKNMTVIEQIEQGLPGLSKSMVSVSRVRSISDNENITEANAVLTDPLTTQIELNDMRERMRSRIDRIMKRFARKHGRWYSHEPWDPYTSYNDTVLTDLLFELSLIPKEEIALIPPEERVFMVRGPPIDFYVVALENDGNISVFNIDIMFHAEHFTGKEKEEYIKMLAAGSGGRASDYLVPPEDKQAGVIIEKAVSDWSKKVITQEQLMEVLRQYGTRVFPFKTANTNFTHPVADKIVETNAIGIEEAFMNEMVSKGRISEEGVERVAKAAAEKIKAAIDPEKFKESTGGKAVPGMFYEIHRLSTKAGQIATNFSEGRQLWRNAREVVRKLHAMRSIRDPAIVAMDGRITSNARIRTGNPEMGKKYSEAAKNEKNAGHNDGGRELKIKVKYSEGLMKKERTDMERKKAQRVVSQLYKASGEVLSNAKELSTPLVVFLQSPDMSEAQETKVASQAVRRISEKYGTSAANVRVVFYSDKETLRWKVESDQAVNDMLKDENGRGVVFSVEGFGVAKEGKEVFSLFRTIDNKEKVYFVEESIPGLRKGEIPEPLVGPRVAFAAGLKYFMMGGESDPRLLEVMNFYLSQMTGESIPLAETARVLKDILDGKPLRIQKINFESLRDQIRAEEAAMMSL